MASAGKWRLCMLLSCHVGIQCEYSLCSSLNVKERLPQNRRDIWSLSEYRTDKYSQRKSIIWPVWQNGWVFVYELNECRLLSHIVLRLNAFAKLQNARGASCQPVLMGNCPTCLYVLALSVYWMVCYQSVPGVVHGMKSCGHERVASWEGSWHEIYTKRGDDTPTHLIRRECPDALGKWRGCSGRERECKTGWKVVLI